MTRPRLSTNPRWSYWASLAAQVLGGAVIIWQGVPIYKQFLIGEPANTANPAVYLWAALSVAIIHSSYWLTFHRTPPVGRTPRPLLGHFVQFTGRAAFIFAAGMFAAVFYLRFGQLGLDWWRYAIILIVLFSMFCVSRTLELLGLALATGHPADRHITSPVGAPQPEVDEPPPAGTAGAR